MKETMVLSDTKLLAPKELRKNDNEIVLVGNTVVITVGEGNGDAVGRTDGVGVGEIDGSEVEEPGREVGGLEGSGVGNTEGLTECCTAAEIATLTTKEF
jgi:hypothetical protein